MLYESEIVKAFTEYDKIAAELKCENCEEFTLLTIKF